MLPEATPNAYYSPMPLRSDYTDMPHGYSEKGTQIRIYRTYIGIDLKRFEPTSTETEITDDFK
jgi:hypothetical protein